MKSRRTNRYLVCALVAFLGAARVTLFAQLSANYVFIPVYGTNACTAKCDVKVINDDFKESFTESFSLLDGKTRTEIDMAQLRHQMFPPAAVKQMGIDKKVLICRPDLKVSYVVFPRLRSYVEIPLGGKDASGKDKEAKMETKGVGNETVAGHPCVKNEITIVTPDGENHKILVWTANDLTNFPIRIESKDGENMEYSTYHDIQFVKPDPSLFEIPKEFTRFEDLSEMMEKMEGKALPDFSDTNSPGKMPDRLASVIDFTLRTGTNRSVSQATARALNLGNAAIPTMQIGLARPDGTLVHLFGISSQNSNDLFIASVDRNTHNGTVWLTSRSGEIRGTVLTVPNGLPTTAPNESRANEFESEVQFFLEAAMPPPWEDVPHPLNVAAKFGQVSDVQAVLKQHPKDINAQDDEGMTPVACAVVQEQPDTVRFLLDQGADPNIPNKNGLTPLAHACGRDKATAMPMVELLLSKGAQVNSTNKAHTGLGPLSWAVSSDNVALVKLLLDHGGDPKAASENGETALHSAADRGDLEIATLLIERGADVNAIITGGTTPLHQAAWNGQTAVMKLLLSKGAQVDPKRSDGITPLFEAAGSGASRHGKACVEALLAGGANASVTDENGNTLLHTAASYGNKEVVELLIERGADVNRKNKRGITPLAMATQTRHPEIAEVLRQHVAKE